MTLPLNDGSHHPVIRRSHRRWSQRKAAADREERSRASQSDCSRLRTVVHSDCRPDVPVPAGTRDIRRTGRRDSARCGDAAATSRQHVRRRSTIRPPISTVCERGLHLDRCAVSKDVQDISRVARVPRFSGQPARCLDAEPQMMAAHPAVLEVTHVAEELIAAQLRPPVAIASADDERLRILESRGSGVGIPLLLATELSEPEFEQEPVVNDSLPLSFPDAFRSRADRLSSSRPY